MKGRTITIVGILIAIAGLLGLELYTLVNDDKNDTISEVVQSTSHKWIFIPFLVGFLMGHWFWPLDIRRKHVSK
jgi:hypothetical protein